MVYSIHGYLLSTYSCGIGVVLSAMGSGWSRLYCQPFSGAQLLELWYGVLEALYVSLARVIWSSHADLSGSGPHKLISLCQALIHRHSPLVAVSCSTSIISLRLGSSASLSSLFKSLLRWSPLFSRSVNQDSPWYGVRVVQSTLQALFRSTIAGVVVQGFRSSQHVNNQSPFC